MRERSPGRWQLRVYLGDDPLTGKPRQVSRTYTAPRREAGAGKREASKQLAKLVAEVERGEHGGTASTFGLLLDEWTAHGERMGRSPKTLFEYRRKIDKQVRPALGAKALDKLTAHDLDRFYASQLASGLGERSVLHLHRIIGAALRQGRKWGWVDRNVAEDATAPTPRRTELSVPSPEQVTALIREAARTGARNPEMAAVITLAALTGMRRGELCGLRWSDIEWQDSAIVVRQSIWQTSDGIGTKAPKTHQTRRLVLGEHAMAVLGGRWERTAADAEMALVPVSPDGYLFSLDADGASPARPDSITQAFTRLCRRMEAPALAKLRETKPKATRVNLAPADRWDYRLHDLRHYTATQLFAAGLNPKTVADRLGHADASVTLRVYTANTSAQAQAAADSLEAGLGMAALPAATEGSQAGRQ
jgi:integrase